MREERGQKTANQRRERRREVEEEEEEMRDDTIVTKIQYRG